MPELRAKDRNRGTDPDGDAVKRGPQPFPEHSDNAGAEALAVRIALYWAERGKTVSAFTVPLGELKLLDRVVYFGVRSDMVDGMPRPQ